VAESDQQLQEQLLQGMADDLHQALDYVAGRIELDLSVLWNEERLFAEIVAENDDIRALRDSLIGQPPEATHDERVQLGERIAAAIQRKSEGALGGGARWVCYAARQMWPTWQKKL
jgi:hypothetical protein